MATDNRNGAGEGQKPVTIFGPDFPFPFDDWIEHPAGLGSIPPSITGRRSPSSAPASPV